MKSEPSPGATRAAEKISLTVAQAADDVWPNLKSMGDWEKRLAEIIDEHTCHKELVEALEMLKRNDQGVRSPAFNMALDYVFNALAKAKGDIYVDFSDATTTITIGQAGETKAKGTP